VPDSACTVSLVAALPPCIASLLIGRSLDVLAGTQSNVYLLHAEIQNGHRQDDVRSQSQPGDCTD